MRSLIQDISASSESYKENLTIHVIRHFSFFRHLELLNLRLAEHPKGCYFEEISLSQVHRHFQ